MAAQTMRSALNGSKLLGLTAADVLC